MAAYSEEYQRGLRDGYVAGESERVALAVANSDLRSDVLELNQMIEELVQQIKDNGL